MMDEKKLPISHYVYLLIWGGSMCVACVPGFGIILGLGFLFIFFLITTSKVLKNILLVAIVSVILAPLFPMLGPLAFLLILMKAGSLIRNWRALLVGLYAYFGYIILMLIGSLALPIVGMGVCTLIFTVMFHKMLKWLYRNGYDTNRAFAVIGLTPLILMSAILPFLKVDIEGIEIFQGSLSDHASIDVHEHIFHPSPEMKLIMKELDISTSDLIKLTGFDINDIIDIPAFSHALETTVASSTAYGVFNLSNYEKEFSVRNEDGTVEIISPINDTQSVIKNQNGEEIGKIYLDRQNNCEVVFLKNGFAYTIDNTTGNIVDGEGKILGRIIKADQDTRLLIDANNRVIRKFEADGTILDNNNHEIGVAAV